MHLLTLKGVFSCSTYSLFARIFILVLAVSASALHPFQSSPLVAGSWWSALGFCIIFFEIRLEQVSLKRLIGAAFGSVLGIFGAFLMSLVLEQGASREQPFLQVVCCC